MKSKHSGKPPPHDDSGRKSVADTPHEKELAVEIAEYTALTSRNTNWMTLQYAMWPILLVYYGLVANLWLTIQHDILVWVSGLVTQVAVMHWCEAGYEIYNNVYYMEHELRPRIQKHIADRDFWKYEPFLKAQRGSMPIWYEYLPLVGVATVLALGFVIRNTEMRPADDNLLGKVFHLEVGTYVKVPLTNWDKVGICVNGLFFAALVRRTIQLIWKRKSMS